MIVNGKKLDFKDITIDCLIEEYKLNKDFVVVELDGEIVPKEDYHRKLKEDSRVELVSFVGGG